MTHDTVALSCSGTIGGTRHTDAPVYDKGVLQDHEPVKGRRLMRYNGHSDQEREKSSAVALAEAAAAMRRELDAIQTAEQPSAYWWTDAELAAVVAGYRDGLSLAEIAAGLERSVEEVGAARARIVQWCTMRKPSGGRGRPRARRVTVEQERRAAELAEQGLGAESIARAIGASVGTVRYVLEHPRAGA